ncbi:unnamed protein product [Pedinophyceae sp. YPF-701]|nr:unnamed protein product [Pedinophyceae sp. YPF-701]
MDDLYSKWFRIADADHDGQVGGGEAVAFFQRSGLHKDVLRAVWELAAGNASFLNQRQFTSAMHLVSIAQQNNGALDAARARPVLSGLAMPPPPPKMEGLDSGNVAPPQASWRSTPAPAAAAKPYTEIDSGAFSDFAPDLGGASKRAAPQGAPAGGGAGGFPLMGAATRAQYESEFSTLDSDRDGFVQGGECFGLFSQSGLSRETLRQVWSLAAGEQGALDRRQYVACRYLMDLVRGGGQLPKSIPAWNFPPEQTSLLGGGGGGSWQVTQGAGASAAAASGDPLAGVLGMPVPEMGARPQEGAEFKYRAELPDIVDEGAIYRSQLPGDSRARLERAVREAGEHDEAYQKAKHMKSQYESKEQWFQAAMQQLTLFKSRLVSRSLDMQQEAAAAQRRAEEAETKLERAERDAQTNLRRVQPILDTIKTCGERTEAAKKRLAELEQELAAKEATSDEDARRAEQEAVALEQQVAAAELRRDQVERGAVLLGQKCEELRRQIHAADTMAEALEVDVKRYEEQAGALDAKRQALTSASPYQDVLACLRSSLELVNDVKASAAQFGLPVPDEIKLLPLKWDPALLEAGQEWGSFTHQGLDVIAGTGAPMTPAAAQTASDWLTPGDAPAAATALAAPAATEPAAPAFVDKPAVFDQETPGGGFDVGGDAFMSFGDFGGPSTQAAAPAPAPKTGLDAVIGASLGAGMNMNVDESSGSTSGDEDPFGGQGGGTRAPRSGADAFEGLGW